MELPPRIVEQHHQDGTVEVEELYSVEEYKPLVVAYVKWWAGRILEATDWRTIKAFETGVPMDQKYVDERAAVRTISNEIETSLAGVTTGEELDAVPWASMLAALDPTTETINPETS